MQLRIGAAAMAAFASACLAVAFQGVAVVDESAPLTAAFTEVGWKSETKPMPFGKAVLILQGDKPQYVFFYEKKGNGFERDLLLDPNVNRKYAAKEAAFNPFVVYRETKEVADVGKAFGVTLSSDLPEIKPVTLAHPPKARKLTPEEGKAVVDALRAQQVLDKTYFDPKGGSTEGLPSGTTAAEAWAQGDYYVLKLKHARFTSVAEDPLVVRTYGQTLSVFYSAPEDGVFLPLHSGFDTVKTLATSAKVGALWNKVEADAGQAMTWFRSRLAGAPESEVWWPVQIAEMLTKLETASPVLGGLVYAKSGATAVAFYYTEEGEPQVVEFDDGEIRATLDIDDAATRAETTTEKELWQCYEGISRQFAHPTIVLALYHNEAMRGG